MRPLQFFYSLVKNYSLLLNFSFVLSALYIVASAIYFFSGFAYGIYVVVLALVPLIFLTMRVIESFRFIDNKISWLVGIGDLSNYRVYTKSLPGYRFVDVYNAVVSISSKPSPSIRIESQHAESLANILNSEFHVETNRRMKMPERVARPVDERSEAFFASDGFWLRAPSTTAIGEIIRVRLQHYTHEVMLEVGAKEQEHAARIIKQVLEHASRHSIFKNKMIEVSFEQEVKDSYGDIERNEKIDPIFIEKPRVMDEDIVLDEGTRKIIQRTIIDFHERRKELMSVGLPGRRGVLFYGPPGTGKTYTCRYISQRLESATTVIAAGMSLLHIKSICNIARMLQPSIVILEDVDLVYSARENSIYTTALGELMDELDGFNPNDHIIFVLTTNAIDRVEAAIRERPGRISQCIYFGAPTPELRRRYLESMLGSYDCVSLDINGLIAQTEGATQAFLKELVYRAVQIATEPQVISSGLLTLSNKHFQEALEEMRQSAGHSGEAIIGFLAKR